MDLQLSLRKMRYCVAQSSLDRFLCSIGMRSVYFKTIFLLCISLGWANAQTDRLDTAQAAARLTLLLDSARNYKASDIKCFELTLQALELEHSVKDRFKLKARLHDLLGSSLGKNGLWREAIRRKQKALQYLRDEKPVDHFGLAMLSGGIGSFYLRIGETDSAFINFRNAYNTIKKTDRLLFVSSACNNLALAHNEAHNYDSAKVYFELALNILNDAPTADAHRRFKTQLYVNYGDLLCDVGDLKAANEIFFKSLDSLNVLQEFSAKDIRKISCFYHLSHNFFKLSNWEMGTRFIDSFLSITNLYQPHIDDKTGYAALLDEQFALAERENRETVDILENISEVRSDIIDLQSKELENRFSTLEEYQRNIIDKQKAIHELEVGYKENELQLERRNNQLNLMIFFIVGTLILASLLMAFVFFRRKTEKLEMQQQKAQLELENKRLQEEKLQFELKAKEEDVLKLALENNRKREWNNEVIQKLKALKQDNGDDHALVLRKIEMELRDELYSNEKVDVFHKNIDQINQAFYDRLKTTFPELTTGDLELCGLIKMKMNGKEIAKLRGISPQSVTKSKQRLRKKMNLPPNGDIVETLEGITQ